MHAVDSPLITTLMGLHDTNERLRFLKEYPEVKAFFRLYPYIESLITSQRPVAQLAALQVVAVGQGSVVFQLPDQGEPSAAFAKLLEQLVQVDQCYTSIGGIAGYHAMFLQLLSGKNEGPKRCFHHPPTVDISQATPEVAGLVRAGIEHLPQMAEIYPVGGAGDRLALTDDTTGKPLPAALLPFGGRTLLEGLFRDLAAREKLAERLLGHHVVTPVVLMTSYEKDNDAHIRAILEEHRWFGRPSSHIFIVTQVSVPVITADGIWAMRAPLELRLKPGGHGALWTLMEGSGAFDWLQDHKRTKGLLRQINNPIAGVDSTLLAFAGVGFTFDKAFGFAACDRQVGSAEGMDVLFEQEEPDGIRVGISNLEYTEFARNGIEDAPKEPGSPYSKFPSNTNLLFFDLQLARKTARDHPLPGVLINLKHKASYLDADGVQKQAPAGRLETSVQNLADFLTVPGPQPNPKTVPTYVTYGRRKKTISVTKKQASPGSSVMETPVGCYLDIMRNYRELLTDYCGIACPEPDAFCCLLSPLLGPLYEVIGQVLRKGRLGVGSELHLDLGNVDVCDLQLEGSLFVKGAPSSSLELRGVEVANEGIDWSAPNQLWKGEIQRLGALEILLEPNAQFVAEGVTLTGSNQIVVPTGTRLRATRDGFVKEPYLPWQWHYAYTDQDGIKLQRAPS